VLGEIETNSRDMHWSGSLSGAEAITLSHRALPGAGAVHPIIYGTRLRCVTQLLPTKFHRKLTDEQGEICTVTNKSPPDTLSSITARNDLGVGAWEICVLPSVGSDKQTVAPDRERSRCRTTTMSAGKAPLEASGCP
jgi:hypothetical protein